MTQRATRNLLLVGDEPAQARLVGIVAGRAGWRLHRAGTIGMAASVLSSPETRIDAILLDLSCADPADDDGVATLARFALRIPILCLVAAGDIAAGIAAIRAGAVDFMMKPPAACPLVAALDAVAGRNGPVGTLRPLIERFDHPLSLDSVVGDAPAFRDALATASRAARGLAPALIEGEAGSGRPTIARAMHLASPRGDRPFVSLDCAGLPAGTLESALFGHERGAFAGAFDRHRGKVEDADGATLFLSGVHALPAGLQNRLSRLIDSGEFRTMGGVAPRPADVRIICAAGPALIAAVGEDRFDAGLYRRLAATRVALPPLRDRSGDVPALARHLLARIALLPGMRPQRIAEDALRHLSGHRWPGNIRQLHDVLLREAIGCGGDTLTRDDFPCLSGRNPADPRPTTRPPEDAGGILLFAPDGHLRPLDAIEADVIRLAIRHYHGRMTEVARRLGIGRSTLYRKLGELGISSAA